MPSYTTIQGDTWDMILFKEYGAGAELEMDKLIAANPAHRATYIFSAGIELTIPAITTPYAAQAVPPWQR